jgi:uncharacterized protein (TIRG00374 family)
VTPESPAAESPAEQTPARGRSRGRTIARQILIWGISLGMLYWIFFVKLPESIDINDVKIALQDLSAGEIALLTLSGLLTVLAVGWTASTVLPGLPLRQGTQASVVGQLTAVVVPPPGDLLIRFAMYRTYGFTNDRSAIAVVLSGIARYFTVVAMPIIGLSAVLITGHGNLQQLVWLAALSTVFGVALWVLRRLVDSSAFAHRLGSWLQRLATRVIRLFRRTPPENLQASVVEFSDRSRAVAEGHFTRIAVSNIAWGFACYLVLLLAMRAVGLDSSDASATQVLLIAGASLLLNSIPITPGGIGLTEAVLLAVIEFPSAKEQAAFTAALLLYRIFTWLLPFPIGAVEFGVWRWQVRRGTVRQAVPAGA